MAIAAGGNTISEPARASFQWLASETLAASAFNKNESTDFTLHGNRTAESSRAVLVAKGRKSGITVANWPQQQPAYSRRSAWRVDTTVASVRHAIISPSPSNAAA